MGGFGMSVVVLLACESGEVIAVQDFICLSFSLGLFICGGGIEEMRAWGCVSEMRAGWCLGLC